MSQFAFGSGMLWMTPQTDAFGNIIAVPTPLMVGVLQEGSVEISYDTKTLHGQNQFAVATARGKGKISGKAKFAQIFGDMFNSIVFGQGATAGLVTAKYDTSGITVAATVTVTPPSSGAFSKDLGVVNALGLPLVKVASAPATGQYACNAATGAYTFAAADVGKTVFINYEYTVSAANAPNADTGVVMNIPMGSQPKFGVDLMIPFEAKTMKLELYACTANKLSLATKQDDFMIPEIDFEAMADSTGRVMRWSTSE